MTASFHISLVWFLGVFLFNAVDALNVRPIPGRSTQATVYDIARRLHLAPRVDGVIFEKSTSLDTSIEDFPLFSYTHTEKAVESTIEIACTKCYIKGEASAKLTSQGEFNISSVAHEVKDAFNDTFHEIRDYVVTVVDELKNYTTDTIGSAAKDVLTFSSFSDIDGFDPPPPQIDFNVDIGDFPDTILEVEFKDTEIYVALGITLSAAVTYELNLYSSKELGVQIDSIFVGVVASIDLILSAESQVEIDTGFHIKLDKSMGMTLALFADEASHLTFNGGSFEFLPVEIATAGVVLRAVLRVGVRTGFSVGVDFGSATKFLNATSDNPRLGAGIEAKAYANVAEFVTNVTANDVNELLSGDECELYLEQGYQFAIGAAAGASVELLDQVWGPVPQTEIPIFYTTLSTGCATSKAVATPTPTTPLDPIRKRAETGSDGSVTATTVTELTFSAFGCASQGMTNCPASLKTLETNKVTSTLTSIVPKGSSVVWPATVGVNAAVTPVPFGSSVMSMTASTGKPKSYTPPPPPSSTSKDGKESGGAVADIVDEKTGGVSNKVIIGVSVGLGVPVIAAVIAGIFFWRRRRAYKPVDVAPPLTDTQEDGDKKDVSTNVRLVRYDED